MVEINLDLHFSYPTEIYTNEFFLIFFENNIMQMILLSKMISCKWLFKIYIIFQNMS